MKIEITAKNNPKKLYLCRRFFLTKNILFYGNNR